MIKTYWNLLWRRLSAQDAKAKAEVERISILQKIAVGRRAEYAEQQGRAVTADAKALPDSLSSSRTRMREAEADYTAALLRWENSQSRQKSR